MRGQGEGEGRGGGQEGGGEEGEGAWVPEPGLSHPCPSDSSTEALTLNLTEVVKRQNPKSKKGFNQVRAFLSSLSSPRETYWACACVCVCMGGCPRAVLGPVGGRVHTCGAPWWPPGQPRVQGGVASVSGNPGCHGEDSGVSPPRTLAPSRLKKGQRLGRKRGPMEGPVPCTPIAPGALAAELLPHPLGPVRRFQGRRLVALGQGSWLTRAFLLD